MGKDDELSPIEKFQEFFEKKLKLRKLKLKTL